MFLSVAQLVTCKQCSPNFQNNDGDTPLHIACYAKSISVIKFFLGIRCSTIIPNKKGETVQDMRTETVPHDCCVLVNISSCFLSQADRASEAILADMSVY